MKSCPLCHHSNDRHVTTEPGNGYQKATIICLTGFCRCGKPALPGKQAKRVRPANDSGKAYREYHGKKESV